MSLNFEEWTLLKYKFQNEPPRAKKGNFTPSMEVLKRSEKKFQPQNKNNFFNSHVGLT
jgi:hypothetical protein